MMLDDDESLLSATRERLSILHRRGQTLVQQLCKFVSSHISLYLDQNVSTMCLSQLPSVLKQQILEELTKFSADPDCPSYRLETKSQSELKVMMKAVQLLLDFDTRSFDFTWVFAAPKSKVQMIEQVLEKVATLAPKISTLTFHRNPWPTKFQEIVDRYFTLTPSMRDSILRMNQLQVLQLQQFKIEFRDLLQLGTCLPNLQKLDIRIVFREEFKVDSSDMEDVQRSFPHLRELLFQVRLEDLMNQQLHRLENYSGNFGILCVRHLPGLEAVGRLVFSSPESFYYGLEAEEVVKLTAPSGLRHLVVWDHSDAVGADFSTLFPDATHLELSNGPGNNFKYLPSEDQENARCAPYLQFTKLVGLRLESPTRRMIECFSISYGANLHSLEVDGSSGFYLPISFKRIFTSFPNLTDLSLTAVEFVPDSEPLDPQLLPLKKLLLSSPIDREPPVIRNILAAPHLEKVDLMHLYLDAGQLQQVTQLVASHQIFRRLKSFLLYFQGDVNANEHCQLVKNLSAHCEELAELSVYAGFDEHSQAWFFEEKPIMEDFLAAFKAYQ